MKKKNKINIKSFSYKFLTVSILLIVFSLFLVSLISYNEFDPSPFSIGEEAATNILGILGAYISSVLIFVYGDSVWLIILGLLLLSKLVIVTQNYAKLILLRIIVIFFSTFMFSMSIIALNLESGILAKVLLVKLSKDLGSFYNDYIDYIRFSNLFLSLIIYFTCLSKNLKSFISFVYLILKLFFKNFKIVISFLSLIVVRKKKININNRNLKKNNINIKYDNKKNYNLPNIDFLDINKSPPTKRNENIDANAKALEKVLDDYGIKGDIINVTVGPIVTRYELEPAPGTRSSRVISLSDDIARSMSAKSARVAVIYGKNAIGIELPNNNIEKVFLKDIIESDSFNKAQGISLALGKDISGKPIITDLSKMPHVLIAGTTGSGKSVSVNAMILSLLYRFNPEECKLILIDPKMLELSVYEDIPHLLHPVVTDPRKAVYALKWAVREMNERYKQMATLGVRNIESYNNIISKKENKKDKVLKKVQIGFDSTTGKPIYQQKEIDLSLLPFLVIVVDEMADLMLSAGKEIELSIQSLAQKARAAGIHLVLATQRPSVDVITGTIKANLPYRISFQVTSKIDSRTILGEQGAEQLLGKGDMLFMAGGGSTDRIHGPFVSDQEIIKVTSFIKNQGQPNYQHHITEDITNKDEQINSLNEEVDPLYEKALNLILKEKKVSTSFLQRHFAIGYNRAARIVDSFENKGIVSAPNSMGRREILINE